MIRKLSYVACDGPCGGDPAQAGMGAKEARAQARYEGFVRRDGQDLCPACAGRTGWRDNQGQWHDLAEGDEP